MRAATPIQEKTARELIRELGRLTVAIGGANNYTPEGFDALILGMLVAGNIKIEHIVALGMGSAMNPACPGGPSAVLESYANALMHRIEEEKSHMEGRL